jgi:hypothetical protein
VVIGAGTLSAQIIPRLPGAARPVQPVRRDTTTDTTGVKWPTPDSVMQRLLSTPGYSITRYQGDTAFFNAQRRSLDLLAAKNQRAVVERDSQMVVSDSGIYYTEATKNIETGGHYIFRPGGGQADITGFGRSAYDMAERSGSIENANLPVNNGETWYMHVNKAKVVMDTSKAANSTIYIGAGGGTMTSCPDSVPDFYFAYKEAKRTGGSTIVARDVKLYIRDIPVLWLPFIFTDQRPGRHSGILAPQFGIGDIVRNSPTYRRNIEHLGYYWALNDYMDASTWIDWRSGAGGVPGDPGWLRTNADWQYKWIDRFLAGRVGLGYTTQADGSTNLAVSWGHQQEFSANSRLNLSANYVTSTTLQRQNTFNPYTALATIASSASYQTKYGPASLSLGATRKQYPGRDQVDQTFPTLTISTTPITAGKWLTWTPGLSLTHSSVSNMDQPGIGAFTYRRNELGVIDSVRASGRGSSSSQISFDTPIQLFGADIKNSFRINQQRNDFPQQFQLYDLETGLVTETRVFAASYKTEIDWNPEFPIPAFPRNRFNLTPSISYSNVAPGPFWVATERTNGKYVHQSKRFAFNVNASPTLFARFRGLGPFSAFRHSIAPTIGYSYAPATQVSDEYLSALGQTKKGYLGNLRQSAINFGLTQNIEAKVRSKADTLATSTGTPIRLLSLTMTPLSYDFERAAKSASRSKLSGFTTETWGYSLNSELLPGFEFSSNYSLFEGSPISDTARFSPYLTSISASFSFGRDQNPFTVLTRLFGKAVPEAQVSPNPATTTVRPLPDEGTARQFAAQPVAGDVRGGNRFIVPPTNGWRAQFQFSRSSPRPPGGNGSNVIDFDPRARCELVSNNDPQLLAACLAQQLAQPTTDTPVYTTTVGGPVYRIPATTSLNGNLAFNLTPMWATTWQTTYDFERHEFASHIVSLQREIHDWRAIFGFTQSPNGNFAFHFTIALKAEPDLKFDYNKATVRAGPSF